MMKMRLTTAPDIEAMTCAIGRKNSLLNNGIETTVRYMMTARMNMRTKLIWKRNWIFFWAWQNMRPWDKIIAPSKLHIFQLRLQLSSCWHAISNINFCIMNTILEAKIYFHYKSLKINFTSKGNILWSDRILTIKHISPAPTTTRFNLRLSGKCGSFIPVIGFFSKKGALAANSGLGRSSSSLKPMQSQWWARLAFLRFQYSKNVTAEKSLNMKYFSW